MSATPKPIGTINDSPVDLANRIVERAVKIMRPVIAYRDGVNVYAICANSLLAMYMSDPELLIGNYTRDSEVSRVAEDVAATIAQAGDVRAAA